MLLLLRVPQDICEMAILSIYIAFSVRDSSLTGWSPQAISQRRNIFSWLWVTTSFLRYYSWNLRRSILWGTSFRRRRAWECISTSLSLSSSTSSIFTEDCLGSVSRGEGEGDSEWVGKLGEIGGVEDLGCTGVGGKGVGANSFTPKGPGADDSISGISLPGGVYSLG